MRKDRKRKGKIMNELIVLTFVWPFWAWVFSGATGLFFLWIMCFEDLCKENSLLILFFIPFSILLLLLGPVTFFIAGMIMLVKTDSFS